MKKFYRVPDEFWYRIHFVRPRFKSNIENVLLYMAKECCRIPDCSCEDYSRRYFNAIRSFPGNVDMSTKTLNNWRTGIPALFGFYQEDKQLDITRTSAMAKFLHEQQDLPQFLRFFLYSFQFPGGHLKPQDLKDVIYHNIRFKPAKSIIQVLMEGNKILSSDGDSREMSISAEEATYCVFNDIRFTNGTISPHDVAKTILENRTNKLKYYNPSDSQSKSLTGSARSRGDMTRYAGDILDYMELANLLVKKNNYFYLKGNEVPAINIFANDTSFYKGYERFYNNARLQTSELSQEEPNWFQYVNDSLHADLFKTDIRNLISAHDEIEIVYDERIKEMFSDTGTTTKDIGNLGESIICGHEKMRLKLAGYDDFIRLVQIVDSPSYHPGYDIDSYEADGTEDHRYIEVKTTISRAPIQIYAFHLSPNEWRVANTIKEHYCVYRLMLSEKRKTLFILRNPVYLYKTDRINAEPRDGMDVSFTIDNFAPEELLIWKK
ncbi:MAG: DUF3883 domain-containing protein [Paludibacteraceae bacterium]|nr:DUF3883 domain-containing protein [Paludibacteraceae bacterium]